MKRKLFFLSLLLLISTKGYSQDFGTLSGTIRLGGGMLGTGFSFFPPLVVGTLRVLPFTHWGDKDFNNWSSEQHGIFRFINVGGDIMIPNWTMSGSDIDINLEHGDGNSYSGNQYTYSVGYFLNWRSHFSRFGLFGGIDYEWKNFDMIYPYSELRSDTRYSSISVGGHNYFDVSFSRNKMNSLTPTIGMRYRLIDPMKEIEGFPFNVVLEAGMSYVVNILYKNDDGYGLDALHNGFRPMLGIAVTTNRLGSIHIRWTKDLYNLFSNDYNATKGPLFENQISNSFSCISIGWALFI